MLCCRTAKSHPHYLNATASLLQVAPQIILGDDPETPHSLGVGHKPNWMALEEGLEFTEGSLRGDGLILLLPFCKPVHQRLHWRCKHDRLVSQVASNIIGGDKAHKLLLVNNYQMMKGEKVRNSCRRKGFGVGGELNLEENQSPQWS